MSYACVTHSLPCHTDASSTHLMLTNLTHFTRFTRALLQGERASVASAMLKVALAAVVYASEQQVRDGVLPALQPDQRRMLTYADVCRCATS
jgi:hypothetical protein